ncbi:MAG: hypothetical protein AAGA90_01305 [Actinomycetota bacterium]
MTAFFVLSYLAGGLTYIDMYRRPYSEWEHADRDRGHWAMVGLMSVIGLGVFFGIAYLMMVVPRFGGPANAGGGHGFGRNDFMK